MSDVVRVERALLSVSDKTGLIPFATKLLAQGIALLASGGTYTALKNAGLIAVEIADYTGQPEILGGRVKTLHPKIHGGILARRDLPEDLEALKNQGIEPIDLVVVNLYPFEQTVAKPGVAFEEAIENIDIGGPSLIRGAAKNHAHVAVITDPAQYDDLIRQLDTQGGTTLVFRQELARSAFSHTSAYDAHIASYLGQVLPGGPFRQTLVVPVTLRGQLRYGENPHQRAAFYVDSAGSGPSVPSAEVLHGKELSYNNLLDLDSALRLIRQFAEPTACVLKHNNPCGAAIGSTLDVAFERAYEGDPTSAFGGIVGLNRPVDLATAARIGQAGRFVEAIIAPSFTPEALTFLTTKPTWRNSVRLLAVNGPIGPENAPASGYDLRRVEGGLLVQTWDQIQADPINEGKCVTDRTPSANETRDLTFAWRLVQSVKSNAIVLAKKGQLLGTGAGQMSRLDSVKIAVEKAGDRARGSVLASDAFFPFRDGPDLAAAAGVTAIIQPGGSKRDEETIAACNEHEIAMIFTGRRHFRH